MKKTSVILTVDTEANIAGGIESYAQGFRPVLDQFVACNIGGRSEGLGFILRTLTERGLRATFFVEAAQAHYFKPAAMGRYVDELRNAGQDVQLHVHPCWFSFYDGVPDLTRLPGDSCAALAEPVLEQFFSQCVATFERWTGERPLALRTGGFRTGRAVYRVMASLGIPLASNLCLGIFKPVESDCRLVGGCQLIEGVREYPCTSFRDARGIGAARWRPLQVRSCSSRELISLLDDAHRLDYDAVVILTHPFEYVRAKANRDRNDWTYAELTPNRVVRARLRRLCDHLSAHEDRFEVCTFSDLAQRPALVQGSPRPLSTSLPMSWARTLENVLSDRLNWL